MRLDFLAEDPAILLERRYGGLIIFSHQARIPENIRDENCLELSTSFELPRTNALQQPVSYFADPNVLRLMVEKCFELPMHLYHAAVFRVRGKILLDLLFPLGVQAISHVGKEFLMQLFRGPALHD